MGGKAGGSLRVLQSNIARCNVCVPHLPLGPRPIVQFSARSPIVIVGQAPGKRVHNSGVPWDDDSGDHLREWLGVTKVEFYDSRRFALVPMGFCYPGAASGGDAPPRPECAPTWHQEIFAKLPTDALILLCGQYAQRYYLGRTAKKNLGETVRAFKSYLPKYLPLPHPSWRSRIWIKNNPWFSTDLLPTLRRYCTRR